MASESDADFTGMKATKADRASGSRISSAATDALTKLVEQQSEVLSLSEAIRLRRDRTDRQKYGLK